MRIKKILAGSMCAVLCALTVTACSSAENAADNSQKQEKKAVELMHKLNIRAPKEVTEITAVFQNTASGETAEVKMEKSGEVGDEVTFCCEADAALYNMVRVAYGDNESMDVAFNSFVSGWYLNEKQLLPYTDGTEPTYDPKFETKKFTFDGRDKKVYIWTPADYDKSSEEKYSVVVLFDGQSVLATGTDREMDNDYCCWNVAESAEAMAAVTDNKTIIVATENNDVYRWDELVPDLGEINTEEEYAQINTEDMTRKRGSAYADFVCDIVLPYVQQNYNVYTDAQHTFLAGASLGGLETFYTVLSRPDCFSAGGVLSATLDMYAEKEWTEFLKDKLSMENAPLLYFYAGGYKTDNGDVTEEMYNKLCDSEYPKDKLVFSKYEPGEHMIECWRNIFPEFLEAAFSKDVTALEFGVPVHYKDTTDPLDEYLEEMELDLNDIEPGYVYYDNSETKWDTVCAYWWGGMAFNSFTKESYYFAEWPGFKMEQIEGTDIYRVVAPWGITGGIIFDSGVTDREVAEGKDAYQTVDLEYGTDKPGKVYKIDLSVEPSTDPGNMKTKRRYPEGSWSEYKPQQ